MDRWMDGQDGNTAYRTANNKYKLTILVNFVNVCADDLCQPQKITRHPVCYKQIMQAKQLLQIQKPHAIAKTRAVHPGAFFQYQDFRG